MLRIGSQLYSYGSVAVLVLALSFLGGSASAQEQDAPTALATPPLPACAVPALLEEYIVPKLGKTCKSNHCKQYWDNHNEDYGTDVEVRVASTKFPHSWRAYVPGWDDGFPIESYSSHSKPGSNIGEENWIGIILDYDPPTPLPIVFYAAITLVLSAVTFTIGYKIGFKKGSDDD